MIRGSSHRKLLLIFESWQKMVCPMGSSPRVPNPRDLFTRRTIHDGGQPLIASYCMRCSAVMFSSRTEVELVEAAHLKWCFRPPLPELLRRRSGRLLTPRTSNALPASPASESRPALTPAPLPARATFYTRRIIWEGERALIESRCTRCGALVIGSVTESLVQEEDAHLSQCAAQPDEKSVCQESSAGGAQEQEQPGRRLDSHPKPQPCQNRNSIRRDN